MCCSNNSACLVFGFVGLFDWIAVGYNSGSSLDKVLKCTCLLEDISMYSDFNEVYLEYFPDAATRPARACFGGNQLPFGAKVQRPSPRPSCARAG